MTSQPSFARVCFALAMVCSTPAWAHGPGADKPAPDAAAAPGAATATSLPEGMTLTVEACEHHCEERCEGACRKSCIAQCRVHVETAPKRKKDKRNWARKALDQISGSGGHAGDVGILIYPTVAYAPETRWEFGFNTVYVYYAENNPANRLSELSAFTFVTQERQYGLQMEHYLYSDKNRWFFYGKAYLQSFPLKYYGIGPDADEHEKALVDGNFVLIRERVLRQLMGSLYLGLSIDVSSMTSVEFIAREGYEDDPEPFGSPGGTNLGLGLGLIYDTCHNAMNVRDGVLGEIGFLAYPSFMSTYPMGSVYFDGRVFFPITDRHVLALQTTGSFTLGKVPFNLLAQIGGGQIMRGYYMGRYRDRNAVAAQIEYRMLPLFWRIGAAFWASVGSVAPDLNFDKLLWTVGGGPRILLFPQKDIFIRIDVGYNVERFGTYIYIGEAF